MAPGSVGAQQMLPNAVGGANVIDHSLISADIADGPRGAMARDTGRVFAISGNTATVVRTLTLNAPAPGKVIGYASGTLEMTQAPPEIAACSISELPQNVETPFRANVNFFEVRAFIQALPFGITRGFDVPAGPFTIHLACSDGSLVERSQPVLRLLPLSPRLPSGQRDEDDGELPFPPERQAAFGQQEQRDGDGADHADNAHQDHDQIGRRHADGLRRGAPSWVSKTPASQASSDAYTPTFSHRPMRTLREE